MNYEAVYRTAPATPDLLTIQSLQYQQLICIMHFIAVSNHYYAEVAKVKLGVCSEFESSKIYSHEFYKRQTLI